MFCELKLEDFYVPNRLETLNLTHQYKGSTTATWHIAGLCIYLVLGLCFCITYGAKMKTSDPTQSCYIGEIYASSLKLFLVPGWKYALQC